MKELDSLWPSPLNIPVIYPADGRVEKAVELLEDAAAVRTKITKLKSIRLD
jgi:hypothetical protein